MAIGGKVETKIFEDDDSRPSQAKTEKFAKHIERKRHAETERYKGNDFMKSKEYREAADAYTRAIELNDTEAASYSNRSLAYLRLKDYGKCIEDANKCLELEPGFLKAFHRRG